LGGVGTYCRVGKEATVGGVPGFDPSGVKAHSLQDLSEMKKEGGPEVEKSKDSPKEEKNIGIWDRLAGPK